MSDIEKSKLIIYQQELLEEQKRQAGEQRELASKERARADRLMEKLDELLQLLKSQEKENARLKEELSRVLKSNAALSEQQGLSRRHRYGSKSQKGTGRSQEEETSREEDKDGFDGTSGTAGSAPDETSSGEETASGKRTDRRKMADFLAYLSFNRFFLNTPLYREANRLRDENMRVSRMTLTNWLHKGSKLLAGIVDALKEKALERDSVVHCGETWCRVKVHGKYRRRYIWCLVNRESRIAIYCYEDGSRGRGVLKSIIEGKELKALQTDGYNVYMYLDNEMVDIDHVCCMAHARAKFKYALEQSGDADAKYILDCMAGLYALEDTYTRSGLTADGITRARQGLKTKEIIGRLRSKMDVLLADSHPPRGELMEKAVRYLDRFWKQIFAYTDNGRYCIDNNMAERCIRPLAGERKNSLFFGSRKMARASAVYHTVIATCRMNGISVLEYLKAFFRKALRGNIEYTRMLPQTIGIQPNVLY